MKNTKELNTEFNIMLKINSNTTHKLWECWEKKQTPIKI